MHNFLNKISMLTGVLLMAVQVFGQGPSALDSSLSFSDKLLTSLGKKAFFIEGKLDRQTSRYLSKLQRQENKLKNKLWSRDSLLSKQLFNGVDEKYAQLKKAPGSIRKYASLYCGHLDSLSTSLELLKEGSPANSAAITHTLESYKALQSKLDQGDAIKKYISERQKLLKEQLSRLGMLKELKGFQKQGYYYAQQVKQYRQAFEDPSKIEEKLLEAVQKLPQFKAFFADNSLLGSLFPLTAGSAASTVSLTGLQTRASLNQSIIDRFGAGAGVAQMIQGSVQSAQGQLGALKNKLNGYSSGSYGNSSSDIELPEGFTPNTQKTKPFLQRLEYGANLQSSKGSSYFPLTSDLGLSLGYKISDKGSLGIGASYKMGWGSNWDHIRITHQGVGLRSYLDIKLKGSLYISGGYEQNYRSQIHSIEQLKDYPAWQSSALIGMNKKYKLKGKLKGEMKLLWDLLSYNQIPKTQAILFRIGYALK
jgi:hypothetical protein